jgi:hypothetical protein
VLFFLVRFFSNGAAFRKMNAPLAKRAELKDEVSF